MQTFLFLFPQLNFSAPKEEAYFKMLGPDDLTVKGTNENTTRFKDKEKKNRLSLLMTRSGSHENVSPEKKPAAKTANIPPEEALRWSDSFEELLTHSDGLETFTQFLRTQFSEENIEFWLACEDYKETSPESKLTSKAKQIYAVYIDSDSPKEVGTLIYQCNSMWLDFIAKTKVLIKPPKPDGGHSDIVNCGSTANYIDQADPVQWKANVNIDYSTKVEIKKNILQPSRSCFDTAQSKVYSLMKNDCYPRFLTSDIYLRIANRKTPGTMYRRRSRSYVFGERSEATGDSNVWL